MPPRQTQDAERERSGLVLGVDGGGTSTEFVACRVSFQADGACQREVVARARTGSTSPKVVGAEAARRNLESGILAIIERSTPQTATERNALQASAKFSAPRTASTYNALRTDTEGSNGSGELDGECEKALQSRGRGELRDETEQTNFPSFAVFGMSGLDSPADERFFRNTIEASGFRPESSLQQAHVGAVRQSEDRSFRRESHAEYRAAHRQPQFEACDFLPEASAQQTRTDAIRQSESDRFLPGSYVLCSDAALPLFACGHDAGVAVVCGTGSVALSLAPDGALVRVGGWGYGYSDRGSGQWVGAQALSHALTLHDAGKPPDELARAVLEEADVDGLDELAAWAIGLPRLASTAQLAPAVLRCAASEAAAILDRARGRSPCSRRTPVASLCPASPKTARSPLCSQAACSLRSVFDSSQSTRCRKTAP